MNHARWKLAREKKITEGYTESPEVEAEREQIRLAHDLGQLVYDRRTAVGLTESVLAERLGISTDDLEAIEQGGALPVTSDLLVRLAAALDVTVDLHVVPEGRNTVAFVARAA